MPLAEEISNIFVFDSTDPVCLEDATRRQAKRLLAAIAEVYRPNWRETIEMGIVALRRRVVYWQMEKKKRKKKKKKKEKGE